MQKRHPAFCPLASEDLALMASLPAAKAEAAAMTARREPMHPVIDLFVRAGWVGADYPVIPELPRTGKNSG